ncbi:Por secretion system C-terminal sorting domain-containing protein [Ekhidna lutea]|uniref:Por secretion system C-terminal sorting domain-containing protein n=1 Tax=Ekhidna lutea TaxID=447679 RepID=A0A239M227_EKHLU|nr:T9SS type A sorting domain-containing protein [Ekhidna lutea]SNT36705.1 Por secretion system C-terminal sorting domain-containing protein [Ekhidna lutea]
MKRLYYCLFSFLAFQLCFGQPYVDKWTASYSAAGSFEMTESATSSIGETYVLGTLFTGSDYDAILVKFDEDGNHDWTKTYSSGYGSSEDYGAALSVDLNDNVFILININPDDAQNSAVANGILIQKYNASGTLLSDYESVNNATVKFGNIGYDIGFIDHPSYSDIYITTSRAASGGMGLEARLWRFDSSLNFEASTKYDTSDDDIPEQLVFAGTRTFMIIRKSTSVQVEGWLGDFASNAEATENRSYSIGSSVEEIIDATSYYSNTELVVLAKLTSGSYRYRVFDIYDFDGISGEFTKTFTSTYTLNDLTVNDNTPMDVYVTGSKTVSGHEEMLLMKLNATGVIQYENLLSATHGSSSSAGKTIFKDGSTLKIGGKVVESGTSHPGSASFDTDGNQTDVSHFNSGSNTIHQMVQGANGENILVGSSGSSTYAYAQCSGPPSVDLGEDIVSTEGQTETLGASLPIGQSYEWSTGATSRTIQVTTDGTYSVAVRNNQGCPASDEVNVSFLEAAPVAPKLLQPVIVANHGTSPVIQINWANDDVKAVSHALTYEVSWNPGTTFNAYNGPNTSYDFTAANLSGDEYTMRVASRNNDNVESGGKLLTLRPCSLYDMSALETYVGGFTLNGPSSFTDAGGTGSFNLSGYSGGDDELDSFFEWVLPAGWEVTNYTTVNVTVAVPADATSGQVGVRIVNPCTGETTSTITKDVYIVRDQTITFNQPSNTKVGAAAFDLGATASSGLAVSYQANPTDILQIVDGMATPLKAGTVTITASQSGDAEWNAAPNVERTLTVNKGDDVITFNALDNVVWNVADFDLDNLASTKSGRQISWSGSDDLIAAVLSLGNVDPKKPGTITITASLGGNSDWNAASDVDQALTVEKANQTITFSPVPNKLVTDDDFQIWDYITVSSGLSPTVVSSQTSVADITGSVLNIIGAGTTTLSASQEGDAYYHSATSQAQSFTVDKLSQTITFDPIPDKTVQDADFDLTATASSNLTVTYMSSNTAVATVTGSTVSIVGEGTTTISADQAGDATYTAAPTVNRSLTVGAGVTVTFDTGYPQFDYFCCGAYKLFLQLTENGNVYYVVEPDGSSEPTPDQIKNGNNASGSAAFKSGSAFSLEAGVENSQSQISGLAESTAYDIYLAVADESFNLSPFVTKLDVVTDDRTAPEWSGTYPKMGTISSLEAEVLIDLNEETGKVYYAVFGSSSTTRFPANLKNGNNFGALDEGFVDASATGFTLTGLTEDREYDVWLVAEDASENLQPVAVKIDFTTIDDIVPEFVSGFPTILAIDETVVDIEVKINEGGTIYGVAQLSGETAPSFAQVKAGNNSDGSLAISSNSLSLTMNELGVLSLSGLTSEVAYDFYVVAEDEHSNSSGTPVKLFATTADLKAPAITPTFLTEVSVTSEEATFSFSLDEAGTFYFVLDGSIVTSPSPAQVKTGKTETDQAALISGSKVVATEGEVVSFMVTGLSAGQEYELFYVAEDDVGNISSSTLSNTFQTDKLDQTITFEALANKVYGDVDFDLTASSSSNLEVTYASSNENVAMVDGYTVTILGAGTTTITAIQSGDDTYNAAANVSQDLIVEKASQSIIFTPLEAKYIDDPTFDLIATGGNSGNPVTFISSDESVATVSGSTVTIVGAGATTITASQAGNDTYEAATDATQELIVGKQSQTITFEAIESKSFGDADFELVATGGDSGNPVTFTSSEESVATVSGSTVTIVGAGATTITASQAGNDTYEAATDATQELIVGKQSQTITLEAIESKSYGDPDFELVATGGDSGNPVTFTSSDESVATVSSNTVTIVGAGTTAITASQAGNDTYEAATDVTQELIVGKQSQTISFEAIESKTFGDADFELVATGGDSGNPVTFISSDESVAIVSGSMVTIVGAGSTVITASQAGSDNYEAATDVTQEVIVGKQSQTITFEAIEPKTFGDTDFELVVTGGDSDNSVTFTSSDESVATVSGSTVTIVGAGATTITASQAGNDTYETATDVTQELIVGKQSQTISFEAIESKTFGDADFELFATGGDSGNPITFTSSDEGVTIVSGSMVTIVGAGTTTITASQVGNDNYEAATDVNQELIVGKQSQTLSFEAIESKTFGDPDFELVATGGDSGNPVAFISSDESVATVSGSMVTIVGAGTTTITASQGGDDTYEAATDVTQELIVGKQSQTISFEAIEAKTFGDADFELVATGGDSGNPITFTSSDVSVATISGSMVTIVGAGTTTITASQAGNDNYETAEDISQELVIEAEEIPTGLSEKVVVTIYPNPVANKLFIDGQNLESVELYTLGGVRIKSWDLVSGNTAISFGEIEQGLYLIQITDRSKKQVLKRIVKK